MRFTYNSGSRPLDGFTLKRGVGRGGFGEVYFAVSDGGKEVALKLLRGETDVELRGVELCLNLKHANLVHLYDLRTDARGDRWVVMEYVAGEALGAVISRHPTGLPHELVREWFLGLTRAVGYLHDHGIVHRDLKPANVFLENGIVKVGDYGLTKSLSGTRRTANTQSVGTVHYMAPEISTGNYTRQIDVYAAGVILYEMLTGRPPFDGESAGEILMKHLTATPDLSKVPSDWAPVVGKALAKNPTLRYGSMNELAKDIDRNAELGARNAEPQPTIAPPRPEIIFPPLPSSELRVPSSRRLSELCGSMILAAVFAALALPLWATLGDFDPTTDPSGVLTLSTVFFLTVAASWSILVPAKLWTEQPGDSWTRRLVMLGLGGLVGFVSLWLGARWPDFSGMSNEGDASAWLLPTSLWSEVGALTYYAAAFFALRWWRLTDRRRAKRFALSPVLAAGFWGLILLPLDRAHPWRGVLVLVLASVIVQLVSPWQEPAAPAAKKVRLRIA
jgi:serine/threonine protein kinase